MEKKCKYYLPEEVVLISYFKHKSIIINNKVKANFIL